MVLRKRSIDNTANEVQLYCSFGLPDVRRLMREYASFLGRDYESSEVDVRYWLEHDGSAFFSWPRKWRKQLSGWAFAVAVRGGLLIPSAVKENRYLLSDCLFVKIGRPRKEK